MPDLSVFLAPDRRSFWLRSGCPSGCPSGCALAVRQTYPAEEFVRLADRAAAAAVAQLVQAQERVSRVDRRAGKRSDRLAGGRAAPPRRLSRVCAYVGRVCVSVSEWGVSRVCVLTLDVSV